MHDIWERQSAYCTLKSELYEESLGQACPDGQGEHARDRRTQQKEREAEHGKVEVGLWMDW